MRGFGATPSYGVGVLHRFLPFFFCTSQGLRFTRSQFVAVALAPVTVQSPLGALAVALLPVGGWLVVPLGAHLGGCGGDLWCAALTRRRPRGALAEDRITGVRFFPPPSSPLATPR